MTRDEIDAVIEQIQRSRATYEAAIASQSSVDMATPDATTCQYCAFRVICRPYWDAVETSWGHGSVQGQVRDAQFSNRGSIILIDAGAPQDSTGSEWVVTAVPGGSLPTSGSFGLTASGQ